jgi:hypothetical protein
MFYPQRPTVSSLHTLLRFVIATGLVGACPAFGQDAVLPATYLSDHDRRVEASLFLSAADIICSRLAPPANFVTHEESSLGSEAGSIGEALLSQTVYQLRKPVEPVLSGMFPETVRDADWTIVQDTKKEPYKAICHLEIHWPDKSVDDGTGFLEPAVKTPVSCRRS